MRKLLVLLTLGIAFSSCSTARKSGGDGQIELKGTIEAAGMTTYQYGTHTLKSADKTYALKSSNVDLGTYEGKSVTVHGTKVEGYPIENGPDFINVTAVKLQ